MKGIGLLCLLAIFSITANCVASSNIGTSICPVPPDSSAPCVGVDNWLDFKSEIGNAQDTLLLCPFDFAKDGPDPIEISRKLTIQCHKRSPTDHCVVRGGPGVLFEISSSQNTVIQGFDFTGSEDHVLYINSPTPSVTHKICHCSFNGNTLTNQVSTGVLLTKKDSGIVHVIRCLFYNNFSAFGGAIFSMSNLLNVVETSFRNNSSTGMGGAVFSARYASLAITGCDFTSSFDSNGVSIVVKAVEKGDGVWFDGGENISTENGSCDGVYNSATFSCASFDGFAALQTTPSPTPPPTRTTTEPFIPNDLTEYDAKTGLHLAEGLTVREIARAGQDVILASGEKAGTFHSQPDGAGLVAQPDGGWLYVSNSEENRGNGGVYAVDFDSRGSIRGYTTLLSGTSRNCNGGLTQWNTWISCEEHARGQCWQVDPFNQKAPEQTLIGESSGGNFEAFTYDDRDAENPVYFVTEDHERGALRRFRPVVHTSSDPWKTLHSEGTRDYLRFIPNTDRFEWTSSLERGRSSAFENYQNTEGISHRNGILYFTSKRTKLLYILNLDTMRYTTEKTSRAPMLGSSEFRQEADHLFQVTDDILYFTEDGGTSPGVYGRVTATGQYFALMEGRDDRFDGDEVTGIAFNPDWTVLYVCMQDRGSLFEIRRANGLPFENRGRRLHFIKLHRRPSRH